jgi:hypothetical protein
VYQLFIGATKGYLDGELMPARCRLTVLGTSIYGCTVMNVEEALESSGAKSVLSRSTQLAADPTLSSNR